MERRITQLFHNNVEVTLRAAESVASLIAAAAKLMADTLIGENKILVAGNGNCSALGQIFVSTLINQLHHERPSLPAIALNANALCSTATQSTIDHIFHKQVRALGQPGDLLLIVTAGEAANINNAVIAACDKDMSVITIGSNTALQSISELLGGGHIEIPLPFSSLSTLYQVQLTTLLTLTDLIDYQLFGVGDLI